jgi:hypothetical protein
VDELDARGDFLADGSDLKLKVRQEAARIGFVSQKRRRFSPLLLWQLSKVHA